MRALVLGLGLALVLTACQANTPPHCNGCDAGMVCVLCDGSAGCANGEVCAPYCSRFNDGGSDCTAPQQCVQVPPAEPYHCCAGCPCAAPHDEQVCR